MSLGMVIGEASESGLHLSIDAGSIPFPFIGEIGVTVVLGWGITAFLLIVLLLVKLRIRSFTETPRGAQNVIELVVDTVEKFCATKLGHFSGEMVPYALAIGSYILLGCLIELFGLPPTTGDLSMTGAMALMTFITIQILGIRHKGVVGRLKIFAQPVAFVSPIKFITELALPISLACRLYGNILAGLIVMELVYFVVPVVIPAALAVYFNLFHAAIQVYIFVMLTITNVGEVVE